MTAEERFNHAKMLFDKGSYLDAVNEFTVITLQYQGSTSAADAQYYLGECRFEREEYMLAAFEYTVVKRNYPASPRVPDALYKLALAYYKLSPKSSLDQQYTKRALDEFQSFVEYYPSHAMAVDADARIKELNTRMAKKQYETARLYAIMEYYRAALFYYDDVIEKYHDTEYAPLAYIDKVDLLVSRDRYKDASVEVNRFLERYPNSVFRSRMEKFKTEIDGVLKPRSRSPESPAAVPPGASL
jgi:outer membrane protein assembly factor BamD